MKVGMIQSNYLPWRGYFDFIDDVDLFIFYDDVQYTHRDWRNRNKIKTRDGLQWISVPVKHDRETLIQEAEIDYSQRWAEKQIKTITLAYKDAKYFKEYSEGLFTILRNEYKSISDLNIELVKWAMKILGINTQLELSSEYRVSGSKYEKPLKILKQIGATSYLSGPAAKPYTDHKSFYEAGINLEYKSYEYKPYPQLWGDFEQGVSVIDLLFNCGKDSYSLIKSQIANEVINEFTLNDLNK